MASVFIRTIIIYIFLIAAMRFLGKRQIGEMQISELVTAFLLSELISQPLTNPTTPMSYAAIPVITLICMEIFFSFLPTKISFFKKLVDSEPSIIVRNGKVDRREMVRMRMSIEDLLCELRIAGYASVDEISYAILEQNGKLSFFKKNAAPVAHPVIIDGKISPRALADSKKSRVWLTSELKKRHFENIRDIFLMTVDDTGKIKIITKEECSA
jgi:uncharacterized membrane protein YcaP (DUF421 family)